jgi:hypothetical protein
MIVTSVESLEEEKLPRAFGPHIPELSDDWSSEVGDSSSLVRLVELEDQQVEEASIKNR